MKNVRWVWPWFKTTCPQCFRKFHPADAPLRLLGEAPGGLEEDVEAGKHLRLGQPAHLNPLVKNGHADFWHRLWRRIRLVNDWQFEHDKVCPYCHLPLPLSVAGGELPSSGVAVLGETAAGKSTFFGVLIQRLREGTIPEDAHFSVLPLDSFDPVQMKRVSSDVLYERVYGRLNGADASVPEPTRLAATEFYPPLIYRLQFNDAPWWSRSLLGRQQAMEVVFFDPGGGDLVDGEKLECYYRHLTELMGLIVLIDPVNLPGVRERLPPEIQARLDPPRQSDALKVVTSLIKLFERYGGISATQKIGTPISIVLTKLDVLRSLFPSDSILFRPSQHDEGYDLEDAEAVSHVVEQWLRSIHQGGIVQLLERFPQRRYCAVSALGTTVEQDQGKRIALTRNPIRVQDPLFSLLHLLGYMKPRRLS